MADTLANDTGTSGSLSAGSTVSGTIESSDFDGTTPDTDWFKIILTAGSTYRFDLKGAPTGDGTLGNPFLRLRNDAGASLTFDDDSGSGLNAMIDGYVAPYSGTYFLSVGPSDAGTGTYKLSATLLTAPQNTTYQLSPSATSMYEGGQVTFTISRTGDKPSETLYFSAWGDTARYADGDYRMLDGSKPENIAVSFSSGQTSKTVTLSILQDNVSDAGERFRAIVQKGPPAADPAVNVALTAYISITNPATTYGLTPAETTVVEGSRTITFTITRSGDKPDETIYASTLFGSASSPGDYDGLVDKAVPFAFGASTATFTVSINDDTIVESQEHFRVMIGRANATSAQALDISDIYIDDNDAPPPASVDTVREGADTTASLVDGELKSGTIDAEPISGDGTVLDGQGGYIDKDWYKVTLLKGHVYSFGGSSLSLSTGSVAISLYDQNAQNVRSVLEGSSSTFTFDTTNQASASQTYYLAISAGGADPAWKIATGNYAVVFQDQGGTTPPPSTDDYRDEDTDTSAPLGALTVGSFSTGSIGPADANDTYGDKDVFAISFLQGHSYGIELKSTPINGQTLPLGIFTVRSGTNFDQVLSTSPISADGHLIFTADSGGTYYIRVGTGGAATDQGGYTLSATEVTKPIPPTPTDDYPDYPGDTNAINGIPTIPMGTGRSGLIGTVGDKDVFAISVIAGHTYQLSLAGNSTAGSGLALQDVFMTLRDGKNFSTQLSANGGAHQAVIAFNATSTGTEYVRIGSGGLGTETGGYQISIADRGVTPSPAPSPVDTHSNVDDALAYAKFSFTQLLTNTAGALADDSTWKAFAAIMYRMNDTEAFQFANRVGDTVGPIARAITFFERIATQVLEAPPGQKARTAYTAFMDAAVDTVITALGSEAGGVGGGSISAVLGSVVPVAGTFAGGLLGAMIGGVVGGESAHLIYEHFLHDWVVHNAGKLFDASFGSISSFSTFSLSISSAAETPYIAAPDESALVHFDTDWYVSTYQDAATAVANGTAGSAYAYFLTTGIDRGEQPNASQHLTRADLPFPILNNDPAALGNSALLTQALGGYAGDGISSAEAAVVNAINASRPAGNTLALDSELSAIASRKAIDLVANFAASAVDTAHGQTDSAWAAPWSNGNALCQQFNAAFTTIFDAANPDSHYKMYAIASPSTDAAAVLAQFEAQTGAGSGLSGTQNNIIGIGEYGGVWVVIVGDHAAGYAGQTPGADGLAGATEYGGGGGDTLYAGSRAGHLFGMDGNDTLVGSAGNDHLDGGTGNDFFYLNGPATSSLAGAVALQPGSEGQDEWVTSKYYNGGMDDDRIRVGGWGDTYDGLIRFDLSTSSLPAQAASAKLRLYNIGSNNGTPTNVLVDQLHTAWTESYRWNDYPLSFTNLGQVTVDRLGWVEFDVTQAVNDWLANPSSNFGLQLRPVSNNNNFDFFVSSDATGELTADRPELVLTWGGTGSATAGDDTSVGGDGNDALYFGGAFTAGDKVDGGAGRDVVALQGNYSAGITLTADGLVGVETLSLLTHSDTRFGGGSASLFSYTLTLTDGTVAAGTQLIVNASGLEAGEALVFDGSAESDGSFFIYGGQGADTLTGGANADVFFFAENGRFGAGDHVDGGGGNDILVLRGSYSIVLDAASMTNIETVTLMSGSDSRFYSSDSRFAYAITTADNTVAAGKTMTFNGGGLLVGETLHFDGSAEQDGAFRVFGGADADVIRGGAGADLLFGGLGADTLTGGGGPDTFRYQDVAESAAANRDTITDFTTGDRVDLARIDAVTAGGDDAFLFVGAAAFTRQAGELRAVQTSATAWLVEGDIDGDGVADFQLSLTISDGHGLSGADFIL